MQVYKFLLWTFNADRDYAGVQISFNSETQEFAESTCLS